ncbi:hypothetical protein [Desulfurobacterium sp.]|uniref:hypothetical protein n=1 Tax=Desulfurobacterium sp. TaxID=2004706 RepID=UPI00262FD5E8|nr:hypothetical protein [Desulfurobacterium sp.]
MAFRPGVVQPGVLLLVSNYAVKHGGDVRIGLELLKKAGVLAEMKGMGKLTVNLVKEVIKSYEPNVKRRLMEEKLTGVNEWIVQKVKERGEVSSGELYKMYSEEIENPISERQFRKHVDELLASGLLNFRWSKGKKGRSRILTYPKK